MARGATSSGRFLGGLLGRQKSTERRRILLAANAVACSVSWMAMEYLALHDGLLQRVTTAGDDLVLHGEPFRERPDDRSRSGVPEGLVTVDSIPSGCRCSWAYSQGRLTLKYSNTACPVLRYHRPLGR